MVLVGVVVVVVVGVVVVGVVIMSKDRQGKRVC